MIAIGRSGLRTARRAGLVLLFTIASTGSVEAQQFNESLLNGFEFRNLGPWRTGAWITDFAVPETPAREHQYTFYVGTRNGGVWKTANGGTTFQSVFDATNQTSIGAVAVAPSDHNTVWVGTGESYIVRYSYAGDGVYKSTDGGLTWQHMGLRDSQHISRIVIHPTNPNVVYVASMGHQHTPNEERGVFRTTDGGRTWKKVLYIDDKVGVIDLVLVPSQPDVLYAASYDKVRYPWHLEAGGPGSAIYKTTNGGDTWTKLGGGLPAGRIGRIGIDAFRANPNILYAVIENINPRRTEGTNERVAGGMGEVYRSDDAGATWRMTHEPAINVGGKAPYSFNMIRIDPQNDQRVYVTSVYIAHTADGGKTWEDLQTNRVLFRRMFGDVRTLWVDPQDPQRILVGSDGGVNVTFDGGRSVDHLSNLPIGEVYAIAADNDDPYNIYMGLQDHESWKGPINGFAGTVGVENWVTTGTGDGMYQAVDPTDSRWTYNTLQFGGHVRVDQQNGTMTRIAPTRPQGQPRYRFTWTTPIALSPHDPKVLYTGAEVVLMSPDRGDTWTEISPDLTTNDRTKQNGSGNIQYTTITTLAESPRQRGVIWVGTDDGNVRLTRDGGKTWLDPLPRLIAAGAPRNYWVTRVQPSRYNDGTAFVTITGYHRDDFRPFVYRTDDFGTTWKPLTATLPENAPANVIIEDPKDPRLLFLGTDRGLFVSNDGGARWVLFKANMPIVPVRDVLVHPRENDLIVGTHGRSVYVTDISALREFSAANLAKPAHLFEIEPKGFRVESGFGNYRLYGDRNLMTQNEPNGIVISWHQPESSRTAATIRITDGEGNEVRVLEQQAGTGIRRAVWNFRDARNQLVAPGNYSVTLRVGDVTETRTAQVKEPVVLRRSL